MLKKSIRKKLLSVLLAGAIIIPTTMLSTGCSSSKNEIVVWNPFTGSDGDYFNKIVEKYNETDPEYKIKNIVVPEMYEKIYTVTNSNKDSSVPDLTVMHAERLKLFKSQGLIDSMDDVIDSQPNIKADNYIGQAWTAGEIDGERYSVPLDVHSSVMFYNKKLLNKYDPKALDDNVVTIDEIKAISKKAVADGNSTYPINNCESWITMSLIEQAGGHVNDGDNPTLNTPEAKKALETFKELVDVGAVQEDGVEAQQLFETGKAVFWQSGIWSAGSLGQIDGLEWGVTNTPAYSADKIVNWSSSHQFALLDKERSDEVKDGIADFLEFVRENSMMWAESGQNAASKEVFESEEYSKLPQSFLMTDEKELESMKIFDFKHNGEALDGLNSVARDVMYGRVGVDEGLAKAQKLVDDKIKEGN